jgi:hypothetical protein
MLWPPTPRALFAANVSIVNHCLSLPLLPEGILTRQVVTVGQRADFDGKQPSLRYPGLNAMTVTGSSVAVLNAAVVNAATIQSYSRKALTQSGVLLLVFSAAATFAGEHSSLPAYGTAAEVMRKVVQNEIRAASDAGTRITFRGIKTTPRGSATSFISRPGRRLRARSSPTTVNP